MTLPFFYVVLSSHSITLKTIAAQKTSSYDMLLSSIGRFDASLKKYPPRQIEKTYPIKPIDLVLPNLA